MSQYHYCSNVVKVVIAKETINLAELLRRIEIKIFEMYNILSDKNYKVALFVRIRMVFIMIRMRTTITYTLSSQTICAAYPIHYRLYFVAKATCHFAKSIHQLGKKYSIFDC